jgi:hypothetical protein
MSEEDYSSWREFCDNLSGSKYGEHWDKKKEVPPRANPDKKPVKTHEQK